MKGVVFMKLGLTSITFRALSIEEIVTESKKNGLETIEWGGDIHCPPGDIEKALLAKRLCKENGLSVNSYGSYYKLGIYENITEEFAKVIASAKAMGASTIRVWAGTIPSLDATPEQRSRMVAEAQQITDMAWKSAIVVAFEYHGGTLTDNCDSAIKLIHEISRDTCRLYWQPNFELSLEKNIADLKRVLPYLVCVHVFSWEKGYARLPLVERINWWGEFIKLINPLNPPLLLEFVKDDSLNQLSDDCKSFLTFKNNLL